MLNASTRVVDSLPGSDSTALEQLPIAAMAFDADKTCTFVTLAGRRLFPDIAPLGARAHAIFADWASIPDLAVEHGNTEPSVSVIRSADGRMFRCEAASDPTLGLFVTLTDISRHVLEAELSVRDGLTGLLQRAALKDRLAQIVAASSRTGAGAAVHFIDLDRFKAVNDTLGHAIGDALLVKVAERLRSTLRKGDLAARLGGDEFIIVQVDVDRPEAAQAVATRITDLIGRSYVIQGHMVNVGASIGTAMFPADGADGETLLHHADLAVYRAKADGRGQSRFFEPSMNARMQARRTLETDMRRALALRQFHLNFQPLVQLANDRISGFEALLRWSHPDRGLVSPADFIPLAEEIGLINPIGEWVLRTACREAVFWPSPATVAVNISPLQFKGGNLAATVASALGQSGLPPERLELEITEGALLDETNLVISTLHTIRSLGVKISMDDFGTGYSSLSYLRKFPFDKIKIDQSFVRGLGESADCNAIVRAVAGLGASLGMRITAEGVETPEQMSRVRTEGCTEVQGYLTGRPLLAGDVVALLRSQAEGE